MPLIKAFTIRLDRPANPDGFVRVGTAVGVTPVAIDDTREATILVLGGAGETGRRVVERLAARGLAVRVGSRTAAPPFDWDDQATWGRALRGVDRVFLNYGIDLAAPGGAERVCLFTALAVELGVRRLVLLAPRDGATARCVEPMIRGASAEWTILRTSRSDRDAAEESPWDALLGGDAVLPAGEPFADVDDVADVAVAALTEEGHAGRTYELTGPAG